MQRAQKPQNFSKNPTLNDPKRAKRLNLQPKRPNLQPNFWCSTPTIPFLTKLWEEGHFPLSKKNLESSPGKIGKLAGPGSTQTTNSRKVEGKPANYTRKQYLTKKRGQGHAFSANVRPTWPIPIPSKAENLSPASCRLRGWTEIKNLSTGGSMAGEKLLILWTPPPCD